jgi:hypothetical protein
VRIERGSSNSYENLARARLRARDLTETGGVVGLENIGEH